ncbi:unnamed protein product [marine sediment metagenome]|uniref:Uncharacterized protein n=1 Tax=marine sediment metagenome TaxID=412755 RepID=X0S262_9ZZZZ
MTNGIKPALERSHAALGGFSDNYPKAINDAITLGALARRLLWQLQQANELLKTPGDLCPTCGGYTWGRPFGPPDENGDRNDFTRRRCSECYEERDNPAEGRAERGEPES